jgi:hypothetical protein
VEVEVEKKVLVAIERTEAKIANNQKRKRIADAAQVAATVATATTTTASSES